MDKKMSENEELQNLEDENSSTDDSVNRVKHLSGMYKSWFLDYASYVILERAVPGINDGLKPVQRRILHSMNRMEDGRFNKVANIIGHTMQFHPHGDASIGDALVQLGQKEILIDTQGNWGNTLTGDSSAAPRYIEARLSKFAREIVFNPKTTEWTLSYDGRNKEPVSLPVKFPLLLAQGVEGIAVGLASKILPHNFNELIDCSIKYLQGKPFELFPDFLTGGMADVSKYNKGLRGGKVRVRARIKLVDKKTLAITEIPFTTTTVSLIDSIVNANNKGKIKIKKIDDNTAENVEILIHLAANVSPDQTIDALYAFTNCEVSISPNSCVIKEEKPVFEPVDEILRHNTDHTVYLLKRELEIRLGELEDNWHNSSLEKIFIENRIYLRIEECETWECVIKTIDEGLEPFKKILRREVVEDDIVRLTEIKIKRISKFNGFKADEYIKGVESEMEEVKNHLNNLIDYSVNYYKQIKKKYGQNFPRKTELRNFDTIEAAQVAVANQKLYLNREDGFAGTSLKKDEFISECSDIDDVIVFRKDGTFMVTRVSPKFFVGSNVLHIEVFDKNDDRTIYNMIYRDGTRGKYYVKRFGVTSITRDKEYDLSRGTEGTKVVYFTANPNGEAEVVRVNLRPKPRLSKTSFDYDFSEMAIKGRNAKGNILTKHNIKNIVQKEEGISTLGAIDVWYDDTVRRLNTDERGRYIGAFKGEDRILSILSTGEFRLTGYDVSTHFDDDLMYLEKHNPKKIVTAVYYDGEQGKYYVKRFDIPETTQVNKKYFFGSDSKGSKFVMFSVDYLPVIQLEIKTKSGDEYETEVIPMADFIGVKSYRAKGKRLSNKDVKKLKFLDPLPYEEEEEEVKEEVEYEVESPINQDDTGDEVEAEVKAEVEAEVKEEVEAETKVEKQEEAKAEIEVEVKKEVIKEDEPKEVKPKKKADEEESPKKEKSDSKSKDDKKKNDKNSLEGPQMELEF
ncbi:MAG: DNA topoisomerase IV [Marinilabiliales bacterium]|nr:MAG: DNA topoisomerase IV [Marinilabiliales bacterium]